MAINKVEITTENGTETLMDLTGDSVTPETLAEGATAHGANGEPIIGTMKAGSADMSKYFETVGSDTLTWDGNTEGLYSVSLSDGDYLSLVSDKVPSLDELKKGGSATFPAINDAPTFVRFTSEDIVDASDDAGMGSGFYVLNADEGSTTFGFVVYEPNATIVLDEEGNTLMVEKTGIYLPKFEGWYPSSLTINGYTGFNQREVLKNEYLNILDIKDEGNTLTWDGNVGDRFSLDLAFMDSAMPEGTTIAVKVSDDTPTIEQLNMGASVISTQKNDDGTIDSTEHTIDNFIQYEDVADMYVNADLDGETSNSPVMSIVMNDIRDINSGVVVLEKGIYVIKVDWNKIVGLDQILYLSSVTFNGYTFKKEVIKKELLPDYFDAVGDGTLTWDGEIGDRLHMDLSLLFGDFPEGGVLSVKISDYVPTLDQLNMGISLTVISEDDGSEDGGNTETAYLTCDTFHELEGFPGVYNNGELKTTDGTVASGYPLVSVITNDVTLPNGTVMEKGIYFVRFDIGAMIIGEIIGKYMHAISVTFNGVSEFNKRDVLKAEHMSIIEEAASDTLSWDGDTEGRTNALGLLYHVSDAIPTGEYLINGGSITLNFQGSDVEKVYFGNNMIFDVDEFGDGQLGEGTVCIIVNTGLGVTPFIFIAKKPNATFNWEMNETLINAVFEKPGVYFPYDQTGLFASPGSRASSFSINGYRGFTRRAVKQEHMPVVSGTIKVSTFGEPVVAYRWLNENFGKKIVKVRVTDYPNTSLAGEYDWVFDKVTKETGNGSDGYLYYHSNTPASNLSTTYYAFHSMKSSNPTPDGISMNFLRGGLYQNQFFIREGSLAVGTEGVTWSFDKGLRNNNINVNNAGAQDTGWKIEFYYIEE